MSEKGWHYIDTFEGDWSGKGPGEYYVRVWPERGGSSPAKREKLKLIRFLRDRKEAERAAKAMNDAYERGYKAALRSSQGPEVKGVERG